MTVTQEDRDAMARIMAMMEGKLVPARSHGNAMPHDAPVELAGPGGVTRRDIDAMSMVLQRLNTVTNGTIDVMLSEGAQPESSEALGTQRTPDGVKIGRWQILIKESENRSVGKQFYAVYNRLTNESIADDISLYETALGIVRLLNKGEAPGGIQVRNLLEADDAYTSHRTDALMYKRKMSNTGDRSKQDIFESRYQASLDRCMQAKKRIKMMLNGR